MPRGPRPHADGYWYHVFSRGGRRQDVFHDDVDRRRFLWLLGVITERFDVEIHAYCLLDNHYHLVIHAPGGNLGDAMHYLGTIYTQRFNARHGYDGKLFRGRYQSRTIGSDAQFLSTVRYVTANAVRHGLVSSADDHPWSSHHGYLRIRPTPGWLVTEVVLSLLGSSASRYRTFIQGYESPAEKAPSIEDVEAYVAASEGVPIPAVVTVRAGVANPARSLLFLLAVDHAGLTPREVARRYGISASTVRSALERERTRLETDAHTAAAHRVARAHLGIAA